MTVFMFDFMMVGNFGAGITKSEKLLVTSITK